MNILANSNLTFSQLPLPIAGKLRMLFSISLGFSLEKQAILEPALAWQAAVQSLSPGMILDLGIPKSQAEWLMAGSTCAPTGTMVNGLKVQIKVGKLQREFLVRGNAEDNGINKPVHEPFATMPLDWNHTYGGPSYRINPQGKGFQDMSLANVLDLAQVGNAAACPGACSSSNPEGTFNTAWLHTRWPGLPDDFNWVYYNQAQPVQRQNGLFTGQEEILITNMHPELARIQTTLPAVRLRVLLEYDQVNSTPIWTEAQANLDTIWLFPNSLAGLMFWHINVPTCDERGSDILQVRAILEDLHQQPQLIQVLLAEPNLPDLEIAEPEPVIIPEPETDSVKEELTLSDSDLPPDTPFELPKLFVLPLTSPDPLSLTQSFDLDMATALEDLEGIVQETNTILIQQGFEPLNLDEVRQKFLAQSDTLKQALAAIQDMPPPESNLSASLFSAGVPANQITKFMQAIELQPPDATTFSSPELYKQALDQYADTLTELTGMDPRQQQEYLNVLEAELKQPEAPEPFALLQEIGYSEEQVQNFKQAFELSPTDTGDAATLAYMQEFTKISGIDFNPAKFIAMLCQTRMLAYNMPDILNGLQSLPQLFPHEGVALNKLLASIQDLPQDKSFDLQSLAQDAGVQEKQVLEYIESIDPFPKAPPPPVLEPVPAITPKPQLAQEQPIITPIEPLNAPELIITDAAGFLAALQSGQDLQGYDLSGLDLQNLDLSGLDLSNLMLDRVNFNGANLVGANLSFSQVQAATFVGANLTGAKLQGIMAQSANFSAANLSQVQAAEARFTEANFTGANLSQAQCAEAEFQSSIFVAVNLTDFAAPQATINACAWESLDFTKTNLTNAIFTDCQLNNCDFKQAKLVRTTFETSNLSGTNFSQADLSQARFYHLTATNTNFSQAKLMDSNWQKVVGPLNLTQAQLTKATFEDCALAHSQLDRAVAKTARWLFCDLHAASLVRIDLFAGSLRGSTLGNANLFEANLYGVDLYLIGTNAQTNLLSADLTNTCLALAEIG